MTKELIILKIGGSVITDRTSETPKVDYENLNRVAKEVSGAYSFGNFQLILVHGAGSYGHQIVKRTGINKGIKTREQVVAFAETQRLQNELNCIVTKALIENGTPAIPCQTSASVVMKGGRIVKFYLSAANGFLDVGLVPVFYGVPAYDEAQGCSILSGDQIAPFVAKKLKADKIIHATDVDGIYTADPNKDKNANHIPLITKKNLKEVENMISGSAHTDVTGGMAGKVREIAGVGIETQIVDATKPGRVKQALRGERVGTSIML